MISDLELLTSSLEELKKIRGMAAYGLNYDDGQKLVRISRGLFDRFGHDVAKA